MKILRDDKGQTLILVALGLPCLLAFVGLATDVGLLLNTKRQLQTAADAAAIAGALNLHYPNAQIVSAGQSASAANGFTNSQNGVTVAVVNGPLWPSSEYYEQTGYIEATVSAPVSTIFMRALGFSTVTVAARAVASNGGPGTGCIYTLEPSGTGFLIDGNVTLSAPQCGLVVDSDMVLKGKAADLTLASIGVAGSYSGAGPPVVNPAPVTGIVPYSDPLSYLPQYSFSSSTSGSTTTYTASCATGSNCTGSPVSVPTTCAFNTTGKKGATSYTVAAGATLSPGCYDELTFPSSGTVTLNPGLYIVDGDLTFDSGAVTGNGVTFYYSGSLNMGSGTYTISAPNDPTQTFNGVLIAQSTADPDDITITGNGSSVFKGIVYAPTVNLTMKGTPAMTIYAAYIVNSIDLRGDVSFTSYAQLSGISNPLSSVVLVE